MPSFALLLKVFDWWLVDQFEQSSVYVLLIVFRMLLLAPWTLCSSSFLLLSGKQIDCHEQPPEVVPTSWETSAEQDAHKNAHSTS